MNAPFGRLTVLGLALALWFIARPFRGIWHDGRLYALQALRCLDPQAFSHDLFLVFGSQDQYSLFSVFYAFAISIGGLIPATAVLQVLALAMWFMAAWALTRALPSRAAVLALLLVATLGGQYGSHWVFSYGESFLSARIYAEAFSLAGLAAWLSGRTIFGALSFAVASLLHPLMTLPALMIGLGLLLQTRTLFALMAAGGVGALTLGALGVSPFTGLLHPMDTSWFDAVAARSPFVFLAKWEWPGFSRALFVVIVAATAWCTLPAGRMRRLAWATLVVILGAFAVDFIGGSLLRLPLIAGLQLTRAIWVGVVIALLLVSAMLVESRQENTWSRLRLWGLALALFLDMRTQGAFALVVVIVCWVGQRQAPNYRPPVWLWILFALVPLQIVFWGFLNANMEAELEVLFDNRIGWRPYLFNPAVVFLLASAAYYLPTLQSVPRFAINIAGAFTVVLLALAAVTWYDVEPAADYDSPARRAAIAPISAAIPTSATVYWVEAPDKVWFWLGRSNYLSFLQTAGSVFSRDTAREAVRRAPYVRAASPYDANQRWDGRPRGQVGLLSERSASAACGDSILDYVIGRGHVGSGAMSFRDPATGWDYVVYDCDALRSAATVLRRGAVDV